MSAPLRAAVVAPVDLRRAASRFATGVALVTAPGGLALVLDSFISASLEPPLVAQNGRYVRLLTLFNQVQFDHIVANRFFLRSALPPVPVGWDTEPDDPWEQFDRAVRFTPFTAAFNVTGQPAVSLPLHWTDDGLPIGVQLVGPPLGDALLLRIAAQLEAAQPWSERRPPNS